MKKLIMLLIPLAVAASGCVVAPYGYHRGYYGFYGPRIVVPAPVVVVRP